MVNDMVDNVVKVDVDVDVSYYNIARLLNDKKNMLESLGYYVTQAEVRRSPSGRHVHLLFTLKEPVPLDTLFYLQFVLGDDPRRAEFNFFRLREFPEVAKYFNVLFEEKRKLGTWDKLKVVIHALYKKVKR